MPYGTPMATQFDTVKIPSETKERLRYVAAIEDRPQGVVFDAALREYIERRADVFRARVDRVSSLLAGGGERIVAAEMIGLNEAELADLEGR